MVRILAISGSLRAVSSNTALLRAAAALAPEGVEVELYGGLGDLPHFNPDLDDPDHKDREPAAVTDLRARVRSADGLLIAAPEYAHGVPGAMKNALDWLVGGDGPAVDDDLVPQRLDELHLDGDWQVLAGTFRGLAGRLAEVLRPQAEDDLRSVVARGGGAEGPGHRHPEAGGGDRGAAVGE